MVFCPEKLDNAVNYAIRVPTGSYFVKKNPHQPRPLDRTDRLILKYLQEDGRLSNVALARKVNLTPTPCLERVRRLEREGYIRGYTALLEPSLVDAGLLVFVEINLLRTSPDAFRSSRSTCCALRPTRFATFAAKQKSCPNCWDVTWSRAISTTC
jgi:DNA-binding Lrp family transcriptional regulator